MAVMRVTDRSRFDLLAVGETMALVTPALAESLESAREFRVEAGGAESNVACHLAGAGRAVSWFGAVGDDALGRRVMHFLSDRGVDVSGVRRDAGASTGLYVKDPGAGVTYYRRDSAASRLDADCVLELPWDLFGMVHVSGITLALSPSTQRLVTALIDAARSKDVLVSFDVNYREALWPSLEEASEEILLAARKTDIVWVGLDEATTLWGTLTPQDVRDLFPEVRHLIVKDADVEASEFSSVGCVVVPTPPVDVVETVGAGDAFAAGWIDAYLAGESSAARLTRGHQFAARVLQSTSDVPPLPRQPEFENERGQHNGY